MNVVKSFRLWCLAFVCVLAVVLLEAPSTASTQGRIDHLESLVKWPACDDLSRTGGAGVTASGIAAARS